MDCRSAPPAVHAAEAHRAVRFDALLQLIGELVQRREIDAVLQLAAQRFKHCADVAHWRLLCVYEPQAVVASARGREVEVRQLAVAELADYDAGLWQAQLPRELDAEALQAERASLPDALADPTGRALLVLPVLQGGRCIAMLSALHCGAGYDALDRKFVARVGAVLAARVVSLLTAQTLTAQRVEAERRRHEDRHAAIVGRLVSGVAHELNTPIGVQISACDVLAGQLAELPAADAADTVELLRQQALRMATIVRRLKQVSALAQGSTPVLAPLVETLELIVAGRGDVTIEGPADLSLELDALALEAVVSELLDNARVHGRGPVRLRASAPGCLEVIDAGPGLDEAGRQRYFEPFHTTRRSQGHVGLGGTIVQSLARDALGARVTLETADGGGLCVRLDFTRCG